MEKAIAPGLYDQLLTQQLEQILQDKSTELGFESTPLDVGDGHLYVARHLETAFREYLRTITDSEAERISDQLTACNAALTSSDSDRLRNQLLADPIRVLNRVKLHSSNDAVIAPTLPLSMSALFANQSDKLNAGAVLKQELRCADQVDLICAFVNFSGVRILETEIRDLCRRGNVRLITTTYLGATQRRALDALHEWGVKIKIAYERPPANTKLHAKAWLFRRNSGFDTAMIGSSNISQAALISGLEWNVRLSRTETPQILDGFQSTFDCYWDDIEFETYDPSLDAKKLDQALKTCGGKDSHTSANFFLDVHPHAYQVDMLEAIAADRARGNNRNLIVAATGTGKTVVAALDYRRLCQNRNRPSLLFVAHRSEILRQSLNVFRNVFRDGSFGELWTGTEKPTDRQHVFATIQTLHELTLDTISPDHFEIVIVDEFHHAEATTYQRLMAHFKPKYLLGLTATPERTDGINVMKFFDDRVTYEMRLWDALSASILSPFQYFGIADIVDLSKIEWKRGRYDERALESAYLSRGRDGAGLILAQIKKFVDDPEQMRAVGFCVSIKHADFLANEFNNVGLNSISLTSKTPEAERRAAIEGLRSGMVKVIFTVDLFNEGVDIPEIDTLLFLRPTESATVFLQQIGRGLRLCEGKSGVTVLDFVGQQHAKFRFDKRFRALTGLSRKELEVQVKLGFTSLPSGCHIELDRVTADRVLANIKAALPSKTQEIVQEFRALSNGDSNYPLRTFLDESGLSLDDLYRNERTFTSIKRQALANFIPATETERQYSNGLSRIIQAVDGDRLHELTGLLAGENSPMIANIDQRSQRLLYMLLSSLDSNCRANNLQVAVRNLWSEKQLLNELRELISLLVTIAPPGPKPLGVPKTESVPLYTHGIYSQDEIITAFGIENPASMRQGVYYSKEHRCDVFLSTLAKVEAHYSPTVRYHDYPMTPSRFHWESQNATHTESPVGQRYINHAKIGTNVILFVRETKYDNGITSPYFCCGPADFVSYTSDRPMKIIWELRTPLPYRVFQQFRAIAG
ncbi:MAG: DUF3427 domain-containing protein [Chthonomonadales bacterium]